MKNSLLVTAYLILFSVSVHGQSNDIIKSFYTMQENTRGYWHTKQHHKIIEQMLPIYQEYNDLNQEQKSKYLWLARDLTYNLSCVYSCINNKKEAVKYLTISIGYGYKNYYHVLKDSDLDNIRNEPGYKKALYVLKQKGDYKEILKGYPGYTQTDFNIPDFSYQHPEELKHLREKHNLDSIAGNGDEFSRIVNLMSWVHNTVPHDGGAMKPKNRSADWIIALHKNENKSFNCRILATVLNEVYLSMGYKSRFVTCKPKGEKFNDCHVINMVYSNQYKKWLWMDPSFEAYLMDEYGTPLSIHEVRERLVNNLPVEVYEKLNWNGKPYRGGEERYLHEYMSKNLFRFSCPLYSTSGYESAGSKRIYVELFPDKYTHDNTIFGSKNSSGPSDKYIINNADLFWRKPE